MAKFGKKRTVKEQVEQHPAATENYEGGLAFTMTAKTELYTRVASCLVSEPKFYVEGEQHNEDLLASIEKVGQEDPLFLLKLAAYTRNELYLRSVPIILLCEATQWLGNTGAIRKYVPLVLKRADEPSEALAYYLNRFGKTFPRGLLKGLADTLPAFDEYALAKYDSKKREVRLRDVLRIVRPKPKDAEQSALWKRAVTGELAVPETWEVVISTQGSTKETWESVMPKMGIFATVRNLRNFLDKDCDLDLILERLEDKDTILKSKMLPFRWYAAWKAIEDHPKRFSATLLMQALEKAIDISVENIPRLPGNTLIWADVSGSMNQGLSRQSMLEYLDVALLMAAMAQRFCDRAVIGCFGSNAEIMNIPAGNILERVAHLHHVEGRLGQSTLAWKAYDQMILEKIQADRVIFLSDMQCYSEADTWAGYYGGGTRQSIAEYWGNYKRKVSYDCKLYSIDLAGYGTTQFLPEDPNVALLAGWSDRVFQFISIFEKDWGEAVKEIERNW